MTRARFAQRGCSDRASRERPQAVCDLGHADIGIGQHGLGGLDVVVGEFRRTSSGATGTSRGGEARSDPLPDQAALELRQCSEKLAALARSSCRGLRSGYENRCPAIEGFRWSRSTAPSNALSDRASTQSACRHCAQILKASCNAGRSATAPDIGSVKIGITVKVGAARRKGWWSCCGLRSRGTRHGRRGPVRRGRPRGHGGY
jgi:hypothetical protein